MVGFLVGLAESQGDRNKSPETCGENKAEQSLLESFDVFSFFLFETPESLLQIRKDPTVYFSFVLALLFTVLNIYAAISELY